MSKVVDTDPLSPPGFSLTLSSPLAVKFVVPPSEIIPEVNFHTNFEVVIDSKPVLPISISRTVTPIPIVVSDDETPVTSIQKVVFEASFVLTFETSVTSIPKLVSLLI